MPASKKMLKNKEQKANREAGIGDAQGRRPSQVKKPEVTANCTKCMTGLRMTKTNADAKMHVDSKHPGVPFADCFPGQYDPTAAAAAPVEEETTEEGKLDIDRIRAEARDRIGHAEGAVPVITDEKKKKKGKEDLSHLFAAAELGGTGRKKK
jgi:hypothetical protein